ncbi:DoxX family protein [Sulfuriroseicoccus oceanibius]|uniref:DoxX family protein n=1 Tax=Sulfuriroseicoccus oceanibius TaxID=2707525 RepID=A0A6B3L5T3_9BACT|nr:DoxX family protein [Sulfuriroseicoccus oceanibius]QQL45915.1 DoxX family protein [Sulfuriroseicoccus oceanibius]
MEFSATTWLQLFSAVSFLGFGVACLVSQRMVAEFERYGIPRFRALTGVLQLLGATGLLVGLKVVWIGALAASGLGVLMLLGFGVRLMIRDGFWRSLPAFLYCVMNIYVALRLW